MEQSFEVRRIMLTGEILAALITLEMGPWLLRSIGHYNLAEAVEQQRQHRRRTRGRHLQVIDGDQP